MRFLVPVFLLLFLTSCVEQQSTQLESTAKTEPTFRYANIEMDIPKEWQEVSSLHVTTFVNKENDNLQISAHSFGTANVKKERLEEEYLNQLKKRFTSVKDEEKLELSDGRVKVFQLKGTLLKRPYIASKSFNKMYNYYVLSAIVYTPEAVLNFWVDGPLAQIEKELLNFHVFLSSYREVDEDSHNHTHDMELNEIVVATMNGINAEAEKGAFDFGEFTLRVPEDWMQIKPEKEMRLAEFKLKSDTRYSMVAFNFGKMDLPVDQIVEQNVMRWRGQFEKLEEEKNIPLEKGNIALIYFRGTFVKKENMMDEKGTQMQDFCVLNAVIPSSKGPYYFRLEAPKEIVEKELNNVKYFLNSYKEKAHQRDHEGHDHDAHDHDSHSDRGNQHDGDSHSERAVGNETTLQLDNLTFTIPTTWEKVTPKSNMRKAQFRPRKYPKYEIPAFLFEDNFTSLKERIEANVKRWETQFQKVDNSKMIDLKIPNAALSYIEGVYTVKASPFAETGTETPGYAALNALIDTKQGQYFFRIVAPKNVVKEELVAFTAFLNSCQIDGIPLNKEQKEHQHDNDSSSDRRSSQSSNTSESTKEVATGEATPLQLDNLNFTVPATWEKVPPKSSMRKAQFRSRKYPKYEIPVFLFQDNFTSLKERIEANVKRWETQFQKVDNSKMIDLEIPEAALSYIEGIYTVKTSPFAESGTDTPGYAALNALIDTPQGQYFFRIVAPKNVVQEELPAFVAFLNSCKK